MGFKIKVKIAQMRLLAQKGHKEALKLALAVVIMEYVIAGGYAMAVKYDLLSFLEPKTVIIKIARANEIEPAPEVRPEEDHIDTLRYIIFNLESTRGKNNYSKCEEVGKYNRYGYGISGNGKYICFDTIAEETKTINNWIENKQDKGMTDNELLCFYNTGSTSGQANGISYQKYCDN